MSDHHDVTWPEPPVGEATYQPVDAIGGGIKNSLYVGSTGLFFAAVQSTMAKENVGAFGVFSRFGGTVALFAGMGGAYKFVSAASANLRRTDDPWNYAYGGFAAGAIAGLRARTFPAMLGSGAALGAVIGIAAYTGSTMFGTTDVHMDEGRWPTKEEMRKRFRRPANETINEIGEGRGIYGPGYDERRAQRLKENHGIDVPKPFWETQTSAEPL